MARRFRYVRADLYPKQEAFLFTPARYSITEASTKSGKTFGCMVWLYERALTRGKRGREFWWVAPVSGQAKIAFDRYRMLLPRRAYRENLTEHYLTLVNGARIWFKSADKPDSLYGDDVWDAVIDESSRCKETAWFAVRSTLSATQGHIRIIGNVRGRRNWAYRLARRAEAGEENMAFHKLTAWDAVEGGVLDREEVLDAQRLLPPDVFAELFLAEPSDDGSNPFGLEHIKRCVEFQRGAAAKGGIRRPRCWGWDFAKSIDWTVGIGLDEAGHMAQGEGNGGRALHRWRKPWEVTIDEVLRLTGPLPAAVDSTGVGDPVTERLQKGGRTNYEGYKFSPSSKQQLMEGLAVAIQRHEVGVEEGVVQTELEEFGFEYTKTGVRYSAPEGFTDDTVMALALAVYKRNQLGRMASRGGASAAI